MAITLYSELQTAAANWLNRADLTTRIPEFIALAEARMNRDKRLRVRDSICRGSLSVSSQFTTLPTDFARMINVEYAGDPVAPLEPLTPQQMDVVRSQNESGDPKYYCIYSTEIEVVPVQSTTVSLLLIYYGKIAALSDSATSNWLLASAPDIYLYATLLQAAPYLHEDERLMTWQSLYDQLCNEYAASSEEDQAGGAPLVVRGPTFY
jgi:hypothetical protein